MPFWALGPHLGPSPVARKASCPSEGSKGIGIVWDYILHPINVESPINVIYNIIFFKKEISPPFWRSHSLNPSATFVRGSCPPYRGRWWSGWHRSSSGWSSLCGSFQREISIVDPRSNCWEGAEQQEVCVKTIELYIYIRKQHMQI